SPNSLIGRSINVAEPRKTLVPRRWERVRVVFAAKRPLSSLRAQRGKPSRRGALLGRDQPTCARWIASSLRLVMTVVSPDRTVHTDQCLHAIRFEILPRISSGLMLVKSSAWDEAEMRNDGPEVDEPPSN